MKRINTFTVLIASAVLCLLSVAFMIFALVFGGNTEKQIVPLYFEKNAAIGYPLVTAEQEFYTISNSISMISLDAVNALAQAA